MHQYVQYSTLLHYSLHRLNEAKASQQQVAVKLQDLHGFYQIVLSNDVLHTDPCPLILSWWQVISDLLPCLLSKLSFILNLWMEEGKGKLSLQGGTEKHLSCKQEPTSAIQTHYHCSTQDSLFFFSRSLSLLMTSRRLTLNLSALNPPPSMMIDYLWTGKHERSKSIQPKLTYFVHLTSSHLWSSESLNPVMWGWPIHRKYRNDDDNNDSADLLQTNTIHTNTPQKH